MKARKRLLWGVLSQGEPGAWDGDTLLFRLDPKNRFHVEQLREPAHIGLIEQCLSEVCQRAVHFEVRLEDGAGAQAVPARRRVLEDPMVKKLLEVLDGEILE